MYKRWHSEELIILYEVKMMNTLSSVRSKYNEYRELCIERGLPDRSLLAFRRKLKISTSTCKTKDMLITSRFYEQSLLMLVVLISFTHSFVAEVTSR